MRKILVGFIRKICVAAVLVIGAVIALDQYYYQNGVFPFGVWMNGVYCTGMTVGEVTHMLDASYDLHADKMEVRTLDGEIHALPLDEYGVTISYEPAVVLCMQRYEKNRLIWLEDFLGFVKPRVFLYPEDYPITEYPVYYCDTAVMRAKLEEADWLNENLYHSGNTVSIIKSATAGYILVDETKDLLLKEDAIELICEKIVYHLTKSRRFQGAMIDLSLEPNRERCYQDIPYTDEMKDTLSKWEGVRDFQDFHMTYQFGDRKEVINENVVADWMALDDNGRIIFDENNNPVLDESMVEEYVAYLSTTYNTVGIEREFQATSGDIVKVSGGSYGNEIDAEAEFAFLSDAFANKENGVRIPQYSSEAKEKGSNDIGDTYIEVDMGNQHMYYYVDGEIVLDTPIVSGNAARGWDTPAKVCYVYFKQKNRVLRGANYATPVKYWMAVFGHIGIHDATWRREFGGEIYKTNGSHGCINTPLDMMAELYDMVEVGTPVILFY